MLPFLDHVASPWHQEVGKSSVAVLGVQLFRPEKYATDSYNTSNCVLFADKRYDEDDNSVSPRFLRGRGAGRLRPLVPQSSWWCWERRGCFKLPSPRRLHDCWQASYFRNSFVNALLRSTSLFSRPL